MQALKPAAHKLASLQSRAWLPPALLLFALSSVFLFGGNRGYFYKNETHAHNSAKALAIADNLSPEHRFLMFIRQTLDADGERLYKPYNRFPIGGFALIKLAILPFGDDLSAKIYVARMLTLLCFAAAAILAYLSLRRITASAWIALTATLPAFSSIYCLYYSDLISNEVMIDLFALMLVFHGMAIFERDGRFRQLLLKACIALLLGWHSYALLLPFIALGLTRELVKARSAVSPSFGALRQLRHLALSLLRSRYLALGVATLLIGVSILTLNFTSEYLALNRETPLTELPSFKSMLNRTGIEASHHEERHAAYRSWPAFMERQFYRIGMMFTPYAFSSSYVLEQMSAYSFVSSQIAPPPPLLFVGLGIAVSGASLIGLLFVRRHKILLASLALSGFCWALPMRHNTAYPWHHFEAIFYIGIALTLLTLILLYLIRLSSERVIAALSVAALLIFAVSALRMSQLNDPNQTAELHQAAIADFEIIRSMTDAENVIQTIVMPDDYNGASISYYLSGRIVMSALKRRGFERPPDFVATGARIDGLASLTPQNQTIFLYDWNNYHRHIDEIIEQADDLIIRSDFDAHLSGSALLYVKDYCREDDAGPPFFLALFPVDESALPVERKQHGFDNLDFYFYNQAVQYYGRCIAITPLPDYDIARIYTGQYIQLADGSTQHLWEGDVNLQEATN